MNNENLIELLKNKLFNKELYNQWKLKQEASFILQCQKHKEKENQEIQHLDIEDYLSLLANQKKSLSFNRFLKLEKINNGVQLQQESYKHFFSIASQANFRRLQHPGYYKSLLSVIHQYPPYFFNAIEKDIHRTFLTNHPFQQSLREVLSAYAIRNPSLIYCQGMNYIVAFLLINQMSSQQTFWFMTCLIENILPDDYFKDLTTISIIICIINDMIEDLFPDFKLQMAEVGMDCSIFIVPWFVCLFTKGFINSVSAFLLNYILLDSRKYRIGYILLKISLALLDIIIKRQQTFRYSKDFKTLKDFLDTKFFEISLSEIQENIELIEINYQIYYLIEDYYRKEKQQNRNETLKSRNKKLSLPPCNKDFPVCFHRIEMQKKAGFIENALILKQGYSIKDHIIQNYLQTEKLSKQSKTIDYNNINQCLIGRHHHICHLNEEDYKTKHTKFQRQQTLKIQLLSDQQENIEERLQYTNVEDRFAEFSEFFVVDENYHEEQNIEEQFKKQLQEFLIEKPVIQNKKLNIQQEKDKQLPKFSLFELTIGKVFKKVGEKLADFKKIRQKRQSQSQIKVKVENLSSVSV